MPFCPWWPLTFDIDLQTHPSERPNTFFTWIWRKSVQRFPRYFIHKQKTTDWRRQKQNLLQFTACGNQQVESSMPLDQRKRKRAVRTWYAAAVWRSWLSLREIADRNMTLWRRYATRCWDFSARILCIRTQSSYVTLKRASSQCSWMIRYLWRHNLGSRWKLQKNGSREF